MGIVFKNNAKTTLASGITDTATSATVVDGSVFPSLGAGEYFFCTFDTGTQNEIVKVTARSGNTLTIVRAQDNTTAKAFSSGNAAELRVTAGVLENIQENIAAKSANQTIYSTTTASSATSYDIGIDPGVEANASVFLDGVYQHHDTFSFSGSTLTFDAAPVDGTALEVIVDNLINLQSSNLSVDTFTAADVGGSPQTDFTLSDVPGAETNLIVFVDGVFQNQDSYTFSNNTLTMTDGVTADRVVTVYIINPVNIGTPSDGTITSAKLSGDITFPGDITVTGDVAFDSPTFVVDNANSRVGIGTAAPSTLLDIVGDVKMSADLTVDTDSLHVDSANNRVGIGTASPSYTLDVDGNISMSGAGTGSRYVILGNETDTYAGSLVLQAGGGSSGFGGSIVAYGHSHASKSGDIVAGISSGSGGSFRVNTSGLDDGSNVLVVEAGGNVGIGTDSPNYVLNTNYNANATFSNAASDFTQMWQNSGTNALGVALSDDLVARLVTNNGYEIAFNNASTETMRIDSSGNVGIGIDDPAQKLHISSTGNTFARIDGGATSTTGVTFDNGDGAVYYDANSNFMRLDTSGSERMRITSTGNVGIGLGGADPSTPLHVKTNSSGYALTLEENSGGEAYQLGTDSFGGLAFFNSGTKVADFTDSSEFQLYDSGAVKAKISPTGNSYFTDSNVGIGITGHNKKLHVSFDESSTTSFNNGIVIGNTNTGTGTLAPILFSTDSGNRIRSAIAHVDTTSYGAGDLAFYLDSDGQSSSSVLATSDEKMRITRGGNVGIGNTNPSEKLTVEGGAIIAGATNDSAGTSGIFLDYESNVGYIKAVSWGSQYRELNTFSELFKVRTGIGGVTERMRVDSSGNAYFNRTSENFNNDGVLIGNSNGGYIYAERSDAGNSILYVHRRANDGNLIDFYQGNSLEGNITVSGTTVSYNGFSGTHDSSGIGVSSSTQVGTVLSTIDEEHKANHAKVKISDIEGDVRVYGVLQEYKEEQTNSDTGITSAEHAVVASVGIGSVLVTGACNGGDLLESNGDGTAKVQSDDIIRSKTIGKVTIGNSDTGVKLVSCVLYCG